MNTKDLQLIRKMTEAELYVIEREPLHRLYELACDEVDRRAGLAPSHYADDPRNDQDDEWVDYADTTKSAAKRKEEKEHQERLDYYTRWGSDVEDMGYLDYMDQQPHAEDFII